MNNIDTIRLVIENYKLMLHEKGGRMDRLAQCDDIIEALVGNFEVVEGPINIIETGASQSWDDGMMGVIFAKIAKLTGGQMWVVDIDQNAIDNSKAAFDELGLDFINYHVGDSVEFLQNFEERVDLIHLDSWDLNLKDPFPSAFHGWREFEAIKDKLEPGAVIIVDDNYSEGTWVSWQLIVDGVYTNESERIDINYPCIGKGTHIKYWAEMPGTGWDLINSNIPSGRSFKVIVQKEY